MIIPGIAASAVVIAQAAETFGTSWRIAGTNNDSNDFVFPGAFSIEVKRTFTPGSLRQNFITKGYDQDISNSKAYQFYASFVNLDIYANISTFPETGTLEVVYKAADTNLLYRWSNNVYVQVGISSAGQTTTPVIVFSLSHDQAAYVGRFVLTVPSFADGNLHTVKVNRSGYTLTFLYDGLPIDAYAYGAGFFGYNGFLSTNLAGSNFSIYNGDGFTYGGGGNMFPVEINANPDGQGTYATPLGQNEYIKVWNAGSLVLNATSSSGVVTDAQGHTLTQITTQ